MSTEYWRFHPDFSQNLQRIEVKEVGVAGGGKRCQTAAVFHIGVVIRSVREERGWTGEELARRAHVSPTTLSHIENGADRFRRQTLRKIALALGVSEADLYAWEKDQRGRIRTALVGQLASDKSVAEQAEQSYPPSPSPSTVVAATEGDIAMADDPQREELLHCFSLLTQEARTELLHRARALTATALTERNRGGFEAHQRKKTTG
jgi:transcriptional regulator with XRE-family HTH domain